MFSGCQIKCADFQFHCSINWLWMRLKFFWLFMVSYYINSLFILCSLSFGLFDIFLAVCISSLYWTCIANIFVHDIIYLCLLSLPFSSVHLVVSNSLWPHESQHARPPCPSPTPRVHSDSRPSSQWCHPAISSSVVPFSSCPQSLPASESFPMSQVFAWGGQSTGVSALVSLSLPLDLFKIVIWLPFCSFWPFDCLFCVRMPST